MIVKRKVTGIKALEYIIDQLDEEKSLSICIRKLPLEKGNIYALVPDNATDEAINDFYGGRLYPTAEREEINGVWLSAITNEAEPLLPVIIEEYLKQNVNNCCLFENLPSKPSDPYLITHPIDYVHRKDEMFFFYNQANNDNGKIEKGMKTSESWKFLGVLSSLNFKDHQKFNPFNEISLSDLEEFASGTDIFFVGAYDHEGYLMWVKEGFDIGAIF